MEPVKTDPIGSVSSGSMLFVSILKLVSKVVSNVRHLFAADDFSRQHLQMHLWQHFKA